MSIDLAWKSVSYAEKAMIIGYISEEILAPHVIDCPSCAMAIFRDGIVERIDNCGAIQHIIDLLRALGITIEN